MLVYFDEDGVLKEQLDSYGNLPRVGSQFFKILAHFHNTDIANEYDVAYITLQKPDLNSTQYPLLFMTQVNLTYDASVPETESNYFANGESYPCYLFDFSAIINDKGTIDTEDDQVVTLLDTPGQWLATITLVSSTTGATNVVGSISFNVDGEDDTEEETVLDYNIIFRSFSTALAQKVNQNSGYYIRSCANFTTKAAQGTLLKSIFVPGSTVFDPAAKAIYQITTVSDNLTDVDHEYVSCLYNTIVEFNDKANVKDTFYVAPTHDWISSNYSNFEDGQVFFAQDIRTFYRKVSGSLETYDIFNPDSIYITADDQDFRPQEGNVLNRKIKKGNKFLYPVTDYRNVLGLQETIVEKLPIIAPIEPSSGFVNRQAWIDISGDAEATQRQLQEMPVGTQAMSFGSGNGQLYQPPRQENPLSNQFISFGDSDANQEISFGGSDT